MRTKVVTSLGKQGTFCYTRGDFVATVMKLDDVNDLSTASALAAEKIIHLKNNPFCVCSETGFQRRPHSGVLVTTKPIAF